MWVPVAILFLGKGEAKGTGAITGFVGITVVLGAFLQTAVFKDPFTGGLLFAQALEKIDQGEIVDAKTIVGLLRVWKLVKSTPAKLA